MTAQLGLGMILLTAVILLVPATLAVFTVRPHAEGGGRVRGVTAAAAVFLAAGVTLLLLDTGPGLAVAGALLLGASVLLWLPLADEWAVRGLIVWGLALAAGLCYLSYVAVWMVQAGLGPLALGVGILLWLLEAFVFLIGVGFLWEFVDVIARREWSSYVDTSAPHDGTGPFVSIHVPAHNEPPDMVIETLEALLRLEYDDYEILLVDNNTTDPALWQPVEAFCAQRDRIRFLHLEDWPGYKSGALNEALRVTDPRAEVIGIVDADYIVEPDWLARCAPLFDEPDVAFVQTPQDYRDWKQAPYFRRLYYSYSYFFDVSQKSRNERNGAIFGGTMGLIRRSSLAGSGGWDEWCITEDAELSLRLLRDGGRGIHVDQSFGHGVMPLTFEALKRQRFRWCFGGIQILRMHWRSLMPGRRTEQNRLTFGQRWAYLVGGLQWFGDLASVFFTGFLLLGATDLLFGNGLVVRRLSGLLMVCLAVLILLGALRSLALVRRTSGASWGEAIGAFGLWLGLGWSVAQGASRGLLARQGVFLRTPKVKGEPRLWDAVRGNRFETGMALLCLAMGVVVIGTLTAGGAFVGGLLLVQGLGFALAPINSLAVIRADLPADLRRRQAWALHSWGSPARRGGAFVFVGAVAVLTLLLAAAPVHNPTVEDLVDTVQEGRVVEPISEREPAEQVEEEPAPGTDPTTSPTPAEQAPAPAEDPAPAEEAPAPAEDPAPAEEAPAPAEDPAPAEEAPAPADPPDQAGDPGSQQEGAGDQAPDTPAQRP